MKRTVVIFIGLLILTGLVFAQIKENTGPGKTALLLIDIQDFYFVKGPYRLHNPEAASLNAGKLLAKFRKDGAIVIHVRHNSSKNSQIHSDVSPVTGEKVISKNFANSFIKTDLLFYLRQKNVKNLVICGMMTHMCVEAAVRAASDYGLNCIVISDACTTRDLNYKDKVVKAMDVHLSTLSTLSGFYATVMDTKEYLKSEVAE